MHQQDCMNHLRCVWCKAVEKEVATALKEMVMDTMDEIAPELRVSCVFSAFARAFDKFFSLSANYPKGKGEDFAEYMKEKYESVLLFHVEGAQGSRHDLSFMAAPAIYMNRWHCLTYALYLLRIPKKQDNILLRNLIVIMTSVEMIAVSRLFSIMYISIILPMRWLAGKTPELAEYNWGPVSMGRALDTLHKTMKEISDKPSLILDEDYMMNIFKEYIDELPPFKEYWNFMFNKKQMAVVARKSGAKVLPLAKLRDECFSPKNSTNKKTEDRVIELAEVAASTMVIELEDPKKATYRYLTISRSEYSYTYATEKRKKDMLGCECTSDLAESALGGCTAQIQGFGRIDIKAAGAVSDLKTNGYFKRVSTMMRGKKKDNNAKGLFHQFSEEVQRCIVMVAMEDAPQTRTENMEELELQRECKRKKEEIMKKEGMEKATEAAIDAHYYWSMYDSDYCVKGDVRNVKQSVNKLSSETRKIEFLKEQVRIRTVGLGWTKGCEPNYDTKWTENKRKKTLKDLIARVEFIVRDEKKYEIPDEPHVITPQPAYVPVLGTRTDEFDELNEKYEDEKDDIKLARDKIRMEREARGEGSMYSTMQAPFPPDLEELEEKRIDVLFKLRVGNESVLRWCQGKVTKVYPQDEKENTVVVQWDPTPDIEGSEESSEGDQVLNPKLWNKERHGAWRMDLDIAPCDNDDGGDDDMNEDMSVNDGESDDSMCESKSEYESSDTE